MVQRRESTYQRGAAAEDLVDPPLAEPLASRGVVIIHYCAQNLRLLPVFGPTALANAPRVGHVHARVGGALWVWAEASGNRVILLGLPPSAHEVLLELMDANHRKLDQGKVRFVVPEKPVTRSTAESTMRRLPKPFLFAIVALLGIALAVVCVVG